MRSIWISLVGPSITGVERTLEAHGFIRASAEEFRYPSIEEPILYVHCQDYSWVERFDLQDEFDELLAAIGGVEPTVHLNADVSGRFAGDSEVRFLARCLLHEHPGYIFDDVLAYSHAWTLKEIEEDASFNGLRFFDYKGAQRLHKHS